MKIGLRTAGSFRRKLQIDHFRLWFVSSDPDPYWTIMIYNYVNDALCVLGALAENAFRVKDSDIRTATDFDVGEPLLRSVLRCPSELDKSYAWRWPRVSRH